MSVFQSVYSLDYIASGTTSSRCLIKQTLKHILRLTSLSKKEAAYNPMVICQISPLVTNAVVEWGFIHTHTSHINIIPVSHEITVTVLHFTFRQEKIKQK